MKAFIESCLSNYPSIFPNEAEVLSHLFTVNGNGVEIEDLGDEGSEAYCFGEPVAIKAVYPLSKFSEFKPYMKYKGCNLTGFKESVEYFIECLKLSKDHDYAKIQPWLDEISKIEAELLEGKVYD